MSAPIWVLYMATLTVIVLLLVAMGCWVIGLFQLSRAATRSSNVTIWGDEGGWVEEPREGT